MTVQEFIQGHSSSDSERETALTLAANYLDSEVKRETGDNNFAACVVDCWDGDRELILNGTDSSFHEISKHEITDFDTADIFSQADQYGHEAFEVRDDSLWVIGFGSLLQAPADMFPFRVGTIFSQGWNHIVRVDETIAAVNIHNTGWAFCSPEEAEKLFAEAE